MAGYNLVQVGNQSDLGAGDFVNLTYGCDNFEGILVKVTKDGALTSGSTAMDETYITILAGTETVCNRVPLSLFASINKFEAGTGIITDFENASNTIGLLIMEIDTGCWYLDKGAELSVQIHRAAAGAGDLTVDVFAKVNGPSVPSPQTWQYRTDNAFMLPLVETLYVFGTNLHLSAENVTMQYGGENVLVPIEAGAMLVNADSVGDDLISNMSACYDGIPREMQINTASTSVSFLAQCKEIVKSPMVRKAKSWIPRKFKSLNAKERIVLSQGH